MELICKRIINMILEHFKAQDLGKNNGKEIHNTLFLLWLNTTKVGIQSIFFFPKWLTSLKKKISYRGT